MIKEIVHFFSAARMEQIVFAYIIGKHQQHRIIQIAVNRMPQMQPHGRITVDCHARREKFARLFESLRKEVNHLTAIHINHGDRLPLFNINFQARTGLYQILSNHFSTSFLLLVNTKSNPILIFLFFMIIHHLFSIFQCFSRFHIFFTVIFMFSGRKGRFSGRERRGREAGGRKFPAVRTPAGGTKLSGKRRGLRRGGAGACGRRAINVGTLSARTEHPNGFACGCTGRDFVRRHPASCACTAATCLRLPARELTKFAPRAAVY